MKKKNCNVVVVDCVLMSNQQTLVEFHPRQSNLVPPKSTSSSNAPSNTCGSTAFAPPSLAHHIPTLRGVAEKKKKISCHSLAHLDQFHTLRTGVKV